MLNFLHATKSRYIEGKNMGNLSSWLTMLYFWEETRSNSFYDDLIVGEYVMNDQVTFFTACCRGVRYINFNGLIKTYTNACKSLSSL